MTVGIYFARAKKRFLQSNWSYFVDEKSQKTANSTGKILLLACSLFSLASKLVIRCWRQLGRFFLQKKNFWSQPFSYLLIKCCFFLAFSYLDVFRIILLCYVNKFFFLHTSRGSFVGRTSNLIIDNSECKIDILKIISSIFFFCRVHD